MGTAKIITATLILISLFSSFSCSRKPEYTPHIRELMAVLEQDPENNMLYEEVIKELYDKGFYKGALEYSEKLIQLDEHLIFGYLYAGVCYEQAGRWDKAEEYYKKICEEQPETAEGYYRLAVLDYKKGRYADCIKNTKKAIASGSQDALWYLQMMIFLAESYYYNKDLDGAYYILEKVLDLDPFNEDALYCFGLWKLREGKYRESIGLFEKLVSQNTQNMYPYLRLGKAYYHSKEGALAEKAFIDASRFDSTIGILAEIVHVEDFGSVYKDVNTATVKVIEKYSYREGDRYYVRGIVENIGLEVAKWVNVVVRFYDKNNKVILQENCEISPRNLRPEQYTFFSVDIPNSDDIYDVKVEPNWHKRSSSIYLK